MATLGSYFRVLSFVLLGLVLVLPTGTYAQPDSTSAYTGGVKAPSLAGGMTGAQIQGVGRNIIVAFSTDGGAPGASTLLQLGPLTLGGVPSAFYLFNLVAGGDYDVLKNSVDLTSLSASFSGSLVFTDNNSSSQGDEYLITLTGVTLEPPSAPTGLVAVGHDDGCIDLSWDPNPESDIIGYTIYFGTESVEGGAATAYPDSIVLSGTSTARTFCGLISGTYYIALRAKNGFGLLSPLSAEVNAVVTNGNTQGPLPPQQVTVTESSPGCVTVAWQAAGGPDVQGYMVYFGPNSVTGGQASSYADSVDAGNQTQQMVCSLSQGTYYFAVKTYAAGGLYSAYSTEKSLAVVGPDVTAPTFSNASPLNGAVGVPINAGLMFTVTDTQTGVDSLSISVTVNGSPATNLSLLAFQSGYIVSYQPPTPFPPLTPVSVSVSASDLASSPNTGTYGWSFTTGDAGSADTTPPAFCCFDPADGAIQVSPQSQVSIGVSDAGSGVDLTSVRLYVNDQSVAFSVEGNSSSAVIRYQRPSGFLPGSVVRIRVEACDLASPVNCTTRDDYTFTITRELATFAPGAIVPDGYWASDPTRPLEVRGLPLKWTVRIFDTAGSLVRSFTNNIAGGHDWTWDFTNNHGQKVARALYLVRVTDATGQVRTTGRFLVQID